MDYRQYDNALGRFHGVDALAELAPDLTPYRFGFNNPVYWSDPTGLFESWHQAIGYMLSHGLSGRIHGSEGEYWITSGSGNETQNMTMIDGNVFTTFGELLSNVSVSNGGGNSSSGLGSFSNAGFGSPSGIGFGAGGAGSVGNPLEMKGQIVFKDLSQNQLKYFKVIPENPKNKDDTFFPKNDIIYDSDGLYFLNPSIQQFWYKIGDGHFTTVTVRGNIYNFYSYKFGIWGLLSNVGFMPASEPHWTNNPFIKK